MSTSYFAHAAYGVLLTYKEANQLRALCHERLDVEENDELDMQDALSQVREDNPTLVEKLRKKYGAPPDAGLLYTGDEDLRPGRCYTGPDQFILGFGLFAFPFRVSLRADDGTKFTEKAEWHMWVEAQ